MYLLIQASLVTQFLKNLSAVPALGFGSLLGEFDVSGFLITLSLPIYKNRDIRASLVAQSVKNPPAMQETPV